MLVATRDGPAPGAGVSRACRGVLPVVPSRSCVVVRRGDGRARGPGRPSARARGRRAGRDRISAMPITRPGCAPTRSARGTSRRAIAARGPAITDVDAAIVARRARVCNDRRAIPRCACSTPTCSSSARCVPASTTTGRAPGPSSTRTSRTRRTSRSCGSIAPRSRTSTATGGRARRIDRAAGSSPRPVPAGPGRRGEIVNPRGRLGGVWPDGNAAHRKSIGSGSPAGEPAATSRSTARMVLADLTEPEDEPAAVRSSRAGRRRGVRRVLPGRLREHRAWR